MSIHANIWLCSISFVMMTSIVQAATTEDSDPIWLGIKNSFSLPIKELLIKPSDNEWRNALDGVSVRASFTHPLSKTTVTTATGAQGEPSTNDSIQVGLQYRPLSYWFVSANFFQYLQPDLQKKSDPDFSYSFGYDDWHPYTLSLSYANSGGNSLGGKRPAFNEGTWTLGWKAPLPEAVQSLLVTGYGDAMACGTSVSLTPQFSDAATSQIKHNKSVWTLGCKYNIIDWWYVNFAVLYYPKKEQQQPWNPDYTYGFGYFDWHPGQISIQYNNYSGNRFSSSERAKGTGKFNNGSISIAWSKSW